MAQGSDRQRSAFASRVLGTDRLGLSFSRHGNGDPEHQRWHHHADHALAGHWWRNLGWGEKVRGDQPRHRQGYAEFRQESWCHAWLAANPGHCRALQHQALQRWHPGAGPREIPGERRRVGAHFWGYQEEWHGGSHEVLPGLGLAIHTIKRIHWEYNYVLFQSAIWIHLGHLQLQWTYSFYMFLFQGLGWKPTETRGWGIDAEDQPEDGRSAVRAQPGAAEDRRDAHDASRGR